MYEPFRKKYLNKIEGKNRFIISGDNDYFLLNSKKIILDSVDKEASVVELNNPKMNVLEMELSSGGDLFSEQKVIVINDLSAISTLAKAGENLPDNIVELIMNSEDILIFYFEKGKIDKRKKVVKNLITESELIDCSEKIKPEQFINYLCSKHHINLTNDVIRELANFTNFESYLIIDKEFEKASLFEGVINKQNVFDVLQVPSEKTVFELFDAMVARNLQQAMDVYDKLLMEQESEYKISAFLTNQFAHLMKIKIIQDARELIDIPSELGLHPFSAKNLEKSAHKYNIQQVLSIHDTLLALDKNIKFGIIPSKTAVRDMILKITTI